MRKPPQNSLRTITLTITDKCNFQCRYCYENATRQNKSLSVSTLNQRLDYAVKCLQASEDRNTPRLISLFGGETLLEFGLVKHTLNKLLWFNEIQDLKLQASLITNGFLLTREVIDYLTDIRRKLGVSLVVSYDGISQNSSRQEGTAEVIRNNLEQLSSTWGTDRRGLYVNTSLGKDSLPHLSENYRYLRSLDIPHIRFRLVYEDFMHHPELLPVLETEVLALFDTIERLGGIKSEVSPYTDIGAPHLRPGITKAQALSELNTRKGPGCNHEFRKVTLALDGAEHLCHRLPFYRDRIDPAECNEVMFRQQGLVINPVCDNCSIRSACYACVVQNKLWTGDYNTVHPNFCAIEKVQYKLKRIFIDRFLPD